MGLIELHIVKVSVAHNPVLATLVPFHWLVVVQRSILKQYHQKPGLMYIFLLLDLLRLDVDAFQAWKKNIVKWTY